MDALQVKMAHWQKEWKIPKTEWKIRGYSRSAYRTGFYIPELDLMLDAGPQNHQKPSTVFITHTHIDHIACLPLTMIGDVKPNQEFQIYAHYMAEKYIANYIKAMFSANAMMDLEECNDWYKYFPVRGGDTFPITLNKNKLSVQVWDCQHSIPTVGYGLSLSKSKLKQEYVGLLGQEIAKLRKSGIEISEEIWYKKLAYVCDTSIDVLEIYPSILEYEVVMIECTFLLPDEFENAKLTKHIHWSQLAPYVIANPNVYFVAFHFSQRYRDAEINDFFQKECLEKNISNLFWW